MTTPAPPPPPTPPTLPPPPTPSGPSSATPNTPAPPGASGEPTWARRLRTLPPNQPWMRWAWVLLGSLIAIPVIALGAFQLVTLLAHEEKSSTLIFDGAEVDALDVSASVGQITVVGSDASEITVTAKVSRGLTATAHSEQIVDGTLELRSSCNHFVSKFCSVDYTVEIPRDTPVILRSDHSTVDVSGMRAPVTAHTETGSVNVRNSNGAMDLRSDNGAILAEIGKGSLLAHSDNGSIRVVFSGVPDQIIATTDNGSIGIVVPRTEAGYAVDASSDLGSVNVADGVHVSSISAHTLIAHSDTGSVTIRHP